jgi:hypothetical protein
MNLSDVNLIIIYCQYIIIFNTLYALKLCLEHYYCKFQTKCNESSYNIHVKYLPRHHGIIHPQLVDGDMKQFHIHIISPSHLSCYILLPSLQPAYTKHRTHYTLLSQLQLQHNVTSHAAAVCFSSLNYS